MGSDSLAMRKSTLLLASRIPPISLPIVGIPCPMASTVTVDKVSIHDGVTRTRVWAKIFPMSFCGDKSFILDAVRRASRSAYVVPHVGTAAKSIDGRSCAIFTKVLMPFIAQGLINVMNRAVS